MRSLMLTVLMLAANAPASELSHLRHSKGTATVHCGEQQFTAAFSMDVDRWSQRIALTAKSPVPSVVEAMTFGNIYSKTEPTARGHLHIAFGNWMLDLLPDDHELRKQNAKRAGKAYVRRWDGEVDVREGKKIEIVLDAVEVNYR